MTLQERLEELINQQKQLEANFHQVTGAVAMVQQMIADEEAESKTEVKAEKKEKK